MTPEARRAVRQARAKALVENLIRAVTLQRKNSLIAGHEECAANCACIASLIETCEIKGVDPFAYLVGTPDPFAYLVGTLEAIAADHSNSRIDDLTPCTTRPLRFSISVSMKQGIASAPGNFL